MKSGAVSLQPAIYTVKQYRYENKDIIMLATLFDDLIAFRFNGATVCLKDVNRNLCEELNVTGYKKYYKNGKPYSGKTSTNKYTLDVADDYSTIKVS
jgi:hypothetical protein